MKHEIMALINNGRQAYVKSGALHQGEAAKAVMVESSDDLTALAGMVSPGSIAYTAGYGSVWQLDAAGSWQDVTEESGGSFDPTITAPQDGDTLVYDATTQKWVNGAGGGGGGLMTVHFVDNGSSGWSASATYAEVLSAITAGVQVLAETAGCFGFMNKEEGYDEIYTLINRIDSTAGGAGLTITMDYIEMTSEGVSASEDKYEVSATHVT